MSNPKRHHWWPQLQSGLWCADDGLINVISPDGTVFRTQPVNVGLEGHLYSLVGADGSKDPQIEKWLSENVDGPFAAILDHAFDLARIYKRPFKGDPHRAKVAKETGYRVNPYLEFIPTSMRDRIIISNYISSLLVRNPKYLNKIQLFHGNNYVDKHEIKNASLKNMLHIYKLYRKIILRSEFILEVRDSSNEYLFGDSGVTAKEPWKNGIPFDLHVPLSPDMALEILPTPTLMTTDISVTRTANAVVSRHNLAVVGDADRFVYSRGTPPLNFIKKHFGNPAPSPFGFRIVNGELEVKYDRSRDRRQ